MSVPDSYAEFNDATAIIRGIMAGTNGTFSGTFSTLNLNVVEAINIRDGAVSAYYGFGFQKGAPSCSFFIPKQEYTQVADISIPIETIEVGSAISTSGGSIISLYKNGVLLQSETLLPSAGTYTRTIHDEERTYYNYMAYIQGLRFVDFDVTENSTYEVQVYNYPPVGSNSSKLEVILQGRVTVAFRKR